MRWDYRNSVKCRLSRCLCGKNVGRGRFMVMFSSSEPPTFYTLVLCQRYISSGGWDLSFQRTTARSCAVRTYFARVSHQASASRQHASVVASSHVRTAHVLIRASSNSSSWSRKEQRPNSGGSGSECRLSTLRQKVTWNSSPG